MPKTKPRIRPWVLDAIDLDLAETVDEFRQALFLETHVTKEFLETTAHERDSKYLIVAPKGYGKTLLLKSKRLAIKEARPDTHVLPDDELIDRALGTPPIFTRDQTDRKEGDIQYWKTLWINSICLSMLHYFDRKALLDIDCDFTRGLAANEKAILPTDVFSALIHASDATYFRTATACAKRMVPHYRALRKPTAVFIDNVDDYFYPQLPAGDNEDAAIYKNRSNRVWVLAQIGLAEAVRELRDGNRHIKLFVSIRKEALDTSYDFTPNAQQLLGISVELNYSKDELRKIFEKNILLEPRSRLVSPTAGSNIVKFVGESNAEITHAYTGRRESFFDFIYRHTLARPRDFMIIGSLLSQINPEERTRERVRRAVFEGATSSAKKHLEDMRPFVPVPANDLFGAINKNVMSLAELTAFSHQYVEKRRRASLYTNGHPFCALYRIGLLGTVEDYEGKLTQKFQQPDRTLLGDVEEVLPRSKVYLIHPSLDESISERRGADYIMNFERRNVIGDRLGWEEYRNDLFVCKGDIERYSEIMNNPEYNRIYPELFRQWTETACQGIRYFKGKEGDSVTMVDGSPLRLIEAATRLQTSLAEFIKLPRRIRFGASSGPIEFRRDQEEAEPEGIALRTAARLEPFATPGWILADESFVAGALQFGLTITETRQVQSQDRPHLLFADGKFRIQKSPNDPAIVTALWELPLLGPGAR